ncbi:MAG: rRNA maturation RNase YbeY [Cyanobacteria bacterium K_DeepCast_35m_m2_023]|nr:rRNA maturation RNase YbeY [Cyanobacteria bacterium K_DeepCast_35m_m2_023]
MIDLDLAFSADPDLAPGLLAAAGPWCAPPQAEAHWQQLLAGWLAQLQAELPSELQSRAYSLGLSLVGDAEIAELNADWRDKAGPTDVLAFAAQDDDLLEAEIDGAPAMPMPTALALGAEALELGDIVISLYTAARQAPEHGNSLEQELLFLASHGLLHLLGWDHPDDASLAAMLQRQDQLVQQR